MDEPRTTKRRLLDAALQPDVAMLGALWLGLAVALASVTYRIADWFKVPDEMVFQRLAQSIAHDHSPIPRIHGEFIRSLNQLYPLLISPIVGGGYVADDLPSIRVLNAVVVTSACIPMYLLARRVTGRRWVAYLMAALSVCLPWIVLSAFMLTEVVALPAFLWAILAIQRAIVQPSTRNDVVALAAIVLAVTARTQFVLLAGVLPLALVAFELRRRSIRSAARRHALLAVVYALLAAVALAIKLSGGTLLSISIYGEQFGRGLSISGVPGWALGHLADLAFGMGLLPFVVGGAWMLANVVRPAATAELQAFACVATAAVLLATYEITTFDLQLGGFIFDRYLMYLVPLFVLALACAVLDERRPRWSLVPPVAAVALGFVLHFQQPFTWFHDTVNGDAPIGVLYRPIVDVVGGRGAAAALLIGLTVLFAAAFLALPRRRLAVVSLAFVAIVLPLETGTVFYKLFAQPGYSSRPLTQSNAHVLDWVDRTVGPNAAVTIVPYPVSSSFLVTQQYWRDIEFWNKSVARHLVYPEKDFFSYTGYWFPKTVLAFDDATGVAHGATRYALQSVGETRFRIAGTVIQQTQEAMLIDAGSDWRLAWRTSGLYEDGWTRPNVTARVRLYASAGQTGPLAHYLTLQMRAPDGGAARPLTVVSDMQRRELEVTPEQTAVVQSMLVCVPPRGFSDVTVTTPATSEIPGGQVNMADSNTPRQGGVLIAGIAVSDETAGSCTPR